MEFRILGSLEVVGDDGALIDLSSGKQRALLTLLLINRNQVVSSDRMVEELWGDER